LGQLVPFQGCTADQLDRIAALGRPVAVSAGLGILSRGSSGRQLVVVLSGSLRVSDHRRLDGELGPGDVVGELAVLSGERRTADVIAAADSVVLLYEREHLDELLSITPVVERLRAIAAARLAAAGRTLVEAASVPVVKRPPRVRGRGAGIRSRTEVPARPVRLAVLALTAIVIASAGSWIVSESGRATAVSLDEALAESRATQSTAELPITEQQPASVTDASRAVTPPAPPATGTEASVSAVAPPVDMADRAPTGTVAPADTAPERAPAPATGPEPAAQASPAAPAFRTPAPGVYTYATSGEESISLAGARHTYPETTHAVVTTTEGCGWHVEHRVIEEHTDIHDRCTTAEAVSVLARGSEVEFFGQRDSLVYNCDPPAQLLGIGVEPGTTSAGSCASGDGEGEARYSGVVVGLEQLTIGGEPVDTVHIRARYELSGRANGTSSVDWWLHAETGLTVREERTVDTRARAVWGDVRYQEDATFELLSLTPAT
jgi:CRP-like cAMP-binding protein